MIHEEFTAACDRYATDEWLRVTLADGRAGMLYGQPDGADDSAQLKLRIDGQITEVLLSDVVSVESQTDWEDEQARPALERLFQYNWGGRAMFDGTGPEGLLREAAKALHFEQYAKALRCLQGYIALQRLLTSGVVTPVVAATMQAPMQVELKGHVTIVTFSHKGATITVEFT